MHQLADAYAFDLYGHLRIDVLAPHGPIDREVPSADESALRPLWAGWWRDCPRCKAPRSPSSIDRSPCD